MKVTETFERHVEGVCNTLCHEQSNARAERLNEVVQEVKTAGEGTENLKISGPPFFFLRLFEPLPTTFMVEPSVLYLAGIARNPICNQP